MAWYQWFRVRTKYKGVFSLGCPVFESYVICSKTAFNYIRTIVLFRLLFTRLSPSFDVTSPFQKIKFLTRIKNSLILLLRLIYVKKAYKKENFLKISVQEKNIFYFLETACLFSFYFVAFLKEKNDNGRQRRKEVEKPKKKKTEKSNPIPSP